MPQATLWLKEEWMLASIVPKTIRITKIWRERQPEALRVAS